MLYLTTPTKHHKRKRSQKLQHFSLLIFLVAFFQIRKEAIMKMRSKRPKIVFNSCVFIGINKPLKLATVLNQSIKPRLFVAASPYMEIYDFNQLDFREYHISHVNAPAVLSHASDDIGIIGTIL